MIKLDQIPRWNEQEYNYGDHSYQNGGTRHPAADASFSDPLTSGLDKTPCDSTPKCKFPAHPEVNSKIYLWRGFPWPLEVDAVVNATSEKIEESVASPGIHEAAGPELAEECSMQGHCLTGDAFITGAYDLPARRVIHTVGPLYSEKFHSAAESMLHRCYWSCLELLVENKLASIAFGCIYSEANRFPREPAAHVALRTVRRFLEKFGSKVHAIVFCTETELDTDIYKRLLPLYFPRDSQEEASAQQLLPADTEDEDGETVLSERKIRISATPLSTSSPSLTLSNDPFSLTPFSTPSITSSATALSELLSPEFLSVTRNPDDRRLESWARSAAAQAGWAWAALFGLEWLVPPPPLTIGEQEALHARCLARAGQVDLVELEEMRIIYRGGVDIHGRNILVVVGAHFIARCIDIESFILHITKELEPISHRPFSIVYFHAAVNLPIRPSLFRWARRLHQALGPKLRRNLKDIYALHPTLGLRSAVWSLETLVDRPVWSRVTYVDRLLDLYRYVPRDQITIPEFILLHDLEVNPQDAMGLGVDPRYGTARMYRNDSNA